MRRMEAFAARDLFISISNVDVHASAIPIVEVCRRDGDRGFARFGMRWRCDCRNNGQNEAIANKGNDWDRQNFSPDSEERERDRDVYLSHVQPSRLDMDSALAVGSARSSASQRRPRARLQDGAANVQKQLTSLVSAISRPRMTCLPCCLNSRTRSESNTTGPTATPPLVRARSSFGHRSLSIRRSQSFRGHPPQSVQSPRRRCWILRHRFTDLHRSGPARPLGFGPVSVQRRDQTGSRTRLDGSQLQGFYSRKTNGRSRVLL